MKRIFLLVSFLFGFLLNVFSYENVQVFEFYERAYNQLRAAILDSVYQVFDAEGENILGDVWDTQRFREGIAAGLNNWLSISDLSSYVFDDIYHDVTYDTIIAAYNRFYEDLVNSRGEFSVVDQQVANLLVGLNDILDEFKYNYDVAQAGANDTAAQFYRELKDILDGIKSSINAGISIDVGVLNADESKAIVGTASHLSQMEDWDEDAHKAKFEDGHADVTPDLSQSDDDRSSNQDVWSFAVKTWFNTSPLSDSPQNLVGSTIARRANNYYSAVCLGLQTLGMQMEDVASVLAALYTFQTKGQKGVDVEEEKKKSEDEYNGLLDDSSTDEFKDLFTTEKLLEKLSLPEDFDVAPETISELRNLFDGYNTLPSSVTFQIADSEVVGQPVTITIPIDEWREFWDVARAVSTSAIWFLYVFIMYVFVSKGLRHIIRLLLEFSKTIHISA